MGYQRAWERARKLANQGYFEILPPRYAASLALKARHQKNKTEILKKLIEFLDQKDGVVSLREAWTIVSSKILRRLLAENRETLQILHLKYSGLHRGDVLSGNRFLKPEFSGNKFLALKTNESGIVRFFMKVFKEKVEENGKERNYSKNDIKAITRWLKRFKLTRAKIHGIIFHLGYKYCSLTGQATSGMKINGYVNHKRRSHIQKPQIKALLKRPFLLT